MNNDFSPLTLYFKAVRHPDATIANDSDFATSARAKVTQAFIAQRQSLLPAALTFFDLPELHQ